MCDSHETWLARFVEENHLVGAVIATCDGERALRHGDFSKLIHGHILHTLFGGRQEIKVCCAALDGRMLPQSYAQGRDHCVYSRTEEGLLYGLFLVDPPGIHEFHLQAKKMAADFERLLKGRELILPSRAPEHVEMIEGWDEMRAEYFDWLRTFPMLATIARPTSAPEIIATGGEPVEQDSPFWSERTREAEARARTHLTDSQIDRIFDEVAAAIDEDLGRFDPLGEYYGQYLPDGDPLRIEAERQAAHSVKRDLAWAAIEQVTGEPGFFCSLLDWYDEGRWPCGWDGPYPEGNVRVL